MLKAANGLWGEFLAAARGDDRGPISVKRICYMLTGLTEGPRLPRAGSSDCTGEARTAVRRKPSRTIMSHKLSQYHLTS
jgi:hypothetical protein